MEENAAVKAPEKKVNLIKNSYLSHQHNNAERRSKFMISLKTGRIQKDDTQRQHTKKAIVSRAL
jgi:hypothetical protein